MSEQIRKKWCENEQNRIKMWNSLTIKNLIRTHDILARNVVINNRIWREEYPDYYQENDDYDEEEKKDAHKHLNKMKRDRQKYAAFNYHMAGLMEIVDKISKQQDKEDLKELKEIRKFAAEQKECHRCSANLSETTGFACGKECDCIGKIYWCADCVEQGKDTCPKTDGT